MAPIGGNVAADRDPSVTPPADVPLEGATHPPPAADEARRPLPAGYRQGVITAITVFIGFSLAFFRFWAFEAEGDWTAHSIAAVIIMLFPICGQIYALYRALRIEDDDEKTYNVTIKWFVWSVAGMLGAVCLSAVVLSAG
jgi:hypothetical protein